MPQVNRSALVMFSARQMYDLVNDVNAYPQFLPGCVGSRIVSLEGNVMVASVDDMGNMSYDESVENFVRVRIQKLLDENRI